MEFVVFSPDGKRLAINNWYQVRIHRVDTGELEETVGGQDWGTGLWSAAFTNDGHYLVTGDGLGGIKSWGLAGRDKTTTFAGHVDCVEGICFSPNGHLFASASRDGMVRLWSARHCGAGNTDRGSWCAGNMSAAALSSDGRSLATGGYRSYSSKVWNMVTRRETAELNGHTDTVLSIVFSPDDTWVLTASADGTARVWDARTGEQVLAVQEGHEARVRAVWSPDGNRFLTVARTAEVWDARSGRKLATFSGLNRAYCASFTSDGSPILPFGDGRQAHIMDVSAGEARMIFGGHQKPIYAMAFASDREWLATASLDKTAKIYEVATGRELAAMKGHRRGVFSLGFSPDTRRMVTGGADRTARIWDTATGRELLMLEARTQAVNAVSFLPDGRRVMIFSSGGQVQLRDAYDWTLTREQIERQRLEAYREFVAGDAETLDTER